MGTAEIVLDAVLGAARPEQRVRWILAQEKGTLRRERAPCPAGVCETYLDERGALFTVQRPLGAGLLRYAP